MLVGMDMCVLDSRLQQLAVLRKHRMPTIPMLAVSSLPARAPAEKEEASHNHKRTVRALRSGDVGLVHRGVGVG